MVMEKGKIYYAVYFWGCWMVKKGKIYHAGYSGVTAIPMVNILFKVKDVKDGVIFNEYKYRFVAIPLASDRGMREDEWTLGGTFKISQVREVLPEELPLYINMAVKYPAFSVVLNSL
jgi:hypothetical protein